ncbi:SDR family oxidoreductase [Undibacterium terreum]|uniref:Short-chain dehydrogenase/reductase n=1 Tax=Undibacterium terreum TaxID=1224302 RepID=A0A916UTM3_9BURK|nr:SDR family oxidoreductase [Undibacterium terreum]GGC86268.1 short-chain dehydrogenase/reductase [Undibacterium terreum]
MPTALIIGASRGIGHELARQYRHAGWRVIATARKKEDLEGLVGLGCEALPLDVNNLNDCAGLGWKLDDEKIDVAILNAGVYGPRIAGIATPVEEDFDQVMHTNVLAAMRLLPILAPLVDNADGRLAVISSRMGSISMRENPSGWLYRASKAALNSVLKDISLSVKSAICIAFHPGWVRTEMGGEDADISVQESADGIRSTIASRKAGDNGKFFNYDGTPLSW